MRATTLRFYKERLLRVFVRIQQGLDEPLSLETLAAVAQLSCYHFHRVFSGMVGESVMSHVRRLRLERAASRLKLGRQPVIQIALEAGYESHEAFCRAFRQSFGLSPSAYRAHNRAPADIQAPSRVHYRAGVPPRDFRARRSRIDPMKVTIQTLPARRVAFMRHVGPYSACGRTWDKLLTFLGKEGHLGGGTLFIGVCHDDPEVTAGDKVRYDACVTVEAAFQPQGEVGVQEIPGGEYAVMTHVGPYAKLGTCYARLLGQWLPRSGRELRSGPCFEAYLNSPENTAPQDLVTDIHVPLEPLRRVARLV